MNRARFIHIAGFLVLLLTITGCSSVDVKRYAGSSLELDLYSYFAGETRGWGMVQDRRGRVIRQFVVDITGTVNDAGELVLDEQFTWSDGERSERIWTISRSAGQRYSGRAADVIGMAEGRSHGNALNWRYLLELEARGSTWTVRFDDWMFLQEDSLLLNRATMSKFGVRLGEVTIAFAKPAAAAQE